MLRAASGEFTKPRNVTGTSLKKRINEQHHGRARALEREPRQLIVGVFIDHCVRD